MEYKIRLDNTDLQIEKKKNDYFINGIHSPYKVEKQDDLYLVYSETTITKVRVLSKTSTHVALQINGKVVEAEVKDHIAIMLEKLGIENSDEQTVNEIKSPMPGVILDVLVEKGQTVTKGEPVLILEAMKMENMLKSPTDGTISTIAIKKGQSVEKNETLITFD